MNFSRNKIWILPLLAIVSYPLWEPTAAGFLAPRESKVTFAKKTTSTDDRNLHLYGITLSQSTGDKLDMVLKADSVATDGEGKDEYFFEKIDCQLYDEQGLPTLITGGEALLAVDKNLITIIDDVLVVTGDEKYRIKTDALRYFTLYKVLKTATAVRFRTGGMKEVCGNSMMYDLKTGAFRVGGGVICDY
jgi:LPS export ABC transporter protein LptC